MIFLLVRALSATNHYNLNTWVLTNSYIYALVRPRGLILFLCSKITTFKLELFFEYSLRKINNLRVVLKAITVVLLNVNLCSKWTAMLSALCPQTISNNFSFNKNKFNQNVGGRLCSFLKSS